jgi:cation transporter-like permease
VPIDKAGVGSGVLNSFRQVGGSLGIALMGAILASYVHPGDRSPQDFVDGLHAALATSAAIAFGAALVAFLLVKPVARQRETRVAAERLAA